MIELRKISGENIDEVIALEVGEKQNEFILEPMLYMMA